MRKQTLGNDEPHWTREEVRQAFLFWLFWSAYVLLSVILAVSLLTDWPKFLHDPNSYLR